MPTPCVLKNVGDHVILLINQQTITNVCCGEVESGPSTAPQDCARYDYRTFILKYFQEVHNSLKILFRRCTFYFDGVILHLVTYVSNLFDLPTTGNAQPHLFLPGNFNQFQFLNKFLL